MTLALPFPDIQNGTDADVSQIMANFNYLLANIGGGGGGGLQVFTPLAAAPASPAVGYAYYDTTLGFPRVYGSDGAWHGILLS